MKCPVVQIISIEAIPDSKLVWVVVAVNGSEPKTLVTGDHYEVGQLGFHVPEGAVLTEKLLREMWLWNEETGKGRLAGKQGNRAKARKIDGVWSDGLFYGQHYFHEGQKVISPSWNPDWQEGQDVANELGITFK